MPEFGELDRTVFGGRPLADQYALQAAGERLGAANWRAMAEAALDDETRDTLASCAPLEEANADALDELLA